MTERHNGANWLTETLSNRPFIVGLLFLGTYFVPFLVLIGLALAYVFRNSPEEEWELSHFHYLIRTFWIAVIGAITTFTLSLLVIWGTEISGVRIDGDSALFGFIAALLVVMVPLLVFCGVRIVLSLMRSAAQKPMPKPRTWLI